MSTPARFLHADTGGYPLPSTTRMDFFALQDRFWQLEAEQPFPPAAAKFYFYWLNRFNAARWCKTLRRFIKQVAADLSMDEKTVSKVAATLHERGLLRYTPGTRVQSAIWELSTSDTLFKADNRNFSGCQPDPTPRLDRKNSAQVAEFTPRTSRDDRKNSGAYKEEEKNSSVVKEEEEEAAPSPSPGALEEKKNTSPSESQSPASGTEGGAGRAPSVHADDVQLTDAEQAPLLNVPAVFKAACLDINPAYAGLDFEHYRLEMRFDSLEKGLRLMPYEWRKRLRHWLANAKTSRAGLLLAAVPGVTKGDPRAVQPLAAKSSASPTKKQSWS